MINFDDVTGENIKKHHPCRILKIGGSGSGKTNALLNSINLELDINRLFYILKIYMKQ